MSPGLWLIGFHACGLCVSPLQRPPHLPNLCSVCISCHINHLLWQYCLAIGVIESRVSVINYKRLLLQRLITFCLFQRVADRLYGVYKVHGNYGRVFRSEKNFIYAPKNLSHKLKLVCLWRVCLHLIPYEY